MLIVKVNWCGSSFSGSCKGSYVAVLLCHQFSMWQMISSICNSVMSNCILEPWMQPLFTCRIYVPCITPSGLFTFCLRPTDYVVGRVAPSLVCAIRRHLARDTPLTRSCATVKGYRPGRLGGCSSPCVHILSHWEFTYPPTRLLYYKVIHSDMSRSYLRCWKMLRLLPLPV